MRESRVLLDGVPFDLQAAGITQWHHEATVESTMDLAHAQARDGAPSGTVVLADVQRAGRGRAGKRWLSQAGDGVWFTLIERDVSPEALQVLSLRIGLALVEALASLADQRLWLKWPNDVLVGPPDGARPAWRDLGKLAGILVEARWREQLVDWVAIGVGVNLRRPDMVPPSVLAGALHDGVRRAQVLTVLVPRLRRTARCDGLLTRGELEAWHAHDVVRERRCVAPGVGVVAGVDDTGALLIHDGVSRRAYRTGSLELEEWA